MTRRATRLAAALAALLLLTACTGAEDEAATPPSKHPVFDENLKSQVSLALRQTLGQQLKGNLPALHAAMGDPLAPGEGFLLNFRGHQFLPRLTRSARGSRATAARHYRELVKAFSEGSTAEPWGERLGRLRAVEAALDQGRASRAHALAEELLRYHAEHPLPPVQELPFVILMLERLQRGEVTPPLVRALPG